MTPHRNSYQTKVGFSAVRVLGQGLTILSHNWLKKSRQVMASGMEAAIKGSGIEERNEVTAKKLRTGFDAFRATTMGTQTSGK